MSTVSNLPEAEYRKLVQAAFSRIERAFAEVDPDVAECELAMGSLTVLFADRSRCILSGQPSVRQIWLALASEGTAYHFDHDARSGRWMDDKGKGIELFSFVESFVAKKARIDFRLESEGK